MSCEFAVINRKVMDFETVPWVNQTEAEIFFTKLKSRSSSRIWSLKTFFVNTVICKREKDFIFPNSKKLLILMAMLLYNWLSIKIQNSYFPFFLKNVSYRSIPSVQHWIFTAERGNAAVNAENLSSGSRKSDAVFFFWNTKN